MEDIVHEAYIREGGVYKEGRNSRQQTELEEGCAVSNFCSLADVRYPPPHGTAVGYNNRTYTTHRKGQVSRDFRG